MNNWVLCSERMPEKRGAYLVVALDEADESEVLNAWFEPLWTSREKIMEAGAAFILPNKEYHLPTFFVDIGWGDYVFSNNGVVRYCTANELCTFSLPCEECEHRLVRKIVMWLDAPMPPLEMLQKEKDK